MSDAEAMLVAQGNKCSICCVDLERTGTTRKSMNIDHCHATGKVRSILCGACNRGLGQFKDDPAVMRKAIAYLESHATK